ncbi:MAG: DUF1778 domain-containing protein [Oscillatoria sp. PMC 1051.18]|nr:DUF1778 domain-containing protein [Oscillatoria sp. PMC 1050.18]MEC5028973.1 DUF1778 domain-containing protein [Oscillatoria sp. PMC 1051.18]
MSTPTNETSITLKLSSEHIERLEKAAAMTGLSLNDYIIHQALIAAIEDIANYDRMVLSDRDRDIFMEALENPPKANEALKAAIKEHQEKYGKW